MRIAYLHAIRACPLLFSNYGPWDAKGTRMANNNKLSIYLIKKQFTEHSK